ncbi:hypothetical protein ACNOYE_07790 [Nannocystaceae bacterium ST9]
MLVALENHLITAVDAALPGGVTTVGGPWLPTAGGAVVVHARSITLAPPGEDPPTDDAAHELEIVSWTADGTTLDFEIPALDTGELVEVEAPPHFTAARGDAYFLDDRTIRFYRAPAAGTPGVRARLRGPAAQGYKRRKPCRIELVISAWAEDGADADERLDIALQTTLAKLISLPNLEAGEFAGIPVWMRVLKARAWLLGVERRVDATSELFETRATLELRGELDLLVAKGTPEPVGVIEQIAGAMKVVRPGAGPMVPETFNVTGQPNPPPAGPRPIEAMTISLLDQLGAQAQSDFDGLSDPVATLTELATLDVDPIVGELVNLGEAKVREFSHRASLVLAFPELPPLAPAALANSLASLLALDPAELSTALDVGLGYAEFLLAELLTLQILLKGSALATLTLADFATS